MPGATSIHSHATQKHSARSPQGWKTSSSSQTTNSTRSSALILTKNTQSRHHLNSALNKRSTQPARCTLATTPPTSNSEESCGSTCQYWKNYFHSLAVQEKARKDEENGVVSIKPHDLVDKTFGLAVISMKRGISVDTRAKLWHLSIKRAVLVDRRTLIWLKLRPNLGSTKAGESQKPGDHLGNSWSLWRRVPPLVKREAAGSREMMTFQINFPKRML